MCQAVAFLIAQPAVHEQLLHLLCWAPVLTFSAESMEAGVWIVGWLLAARADLETPVLTKLGTFCDQRLFTAQKEWQRER